MKAIIVANGRIRPDTDFRQMIQPGDMLIAADGGAGYCLEQGILPRTVIGDFDSLSPASVEKLKEKGCEIRAYSPRKDQTDLELALDAALADGAEEILIYGALGGRWDMSMANIMLLARAGMERCRVRIIDGNQEMILLRGGDMFRYKGKKGDTLSLIPLLPDTGGISLEGLEYPLNNEKLEFGSARGISNVMCGQNATVSLKQGLLLCIRTGRAEQEN